MMEAIFLVDNLEKINDIYKQEAINKNLCDLVPINIYIREDIEKNKSKFCKVRFIFSTWCMPVFSEKEVRDFFPSLEAIFYAAGTVKYFAKAFLQNGVKVYSAARANAIPVAEFVTAQIILANKGYFQSQRAYFPRGGYTRSWKYVNSKNGNYGAKVGLIGAGTVATKVIELLKPYQLELYITDPYISKEKIHSLGAKKVDLLELFKICDVISNHLPDTSETKGELNYDMFSVMKPTATFINTGRGAQVIESDLIRAFKEKPYACALLDVTCNEPLKWWSPLYRMKNIFVTPHIAGSVCLESQRMAEYMYEAYHDYIRGKLNFCEVSMEMLNTMA